MWNVLKPSNIYDLNTICPSGSDNDQFRDYPCQLIFPESSSLLALWAVYDSSDTRNVYLLHTAYVLFLLHGNGKELHTNDDTNSIYTVARSMVLYICFSFEPWVSGDSTGFQFNDGPKLYFHIDVHENIAEFLVKVADNPIQLWHFQRLGDFP